MPQPSSASDPLSNDAVINLLINFIHQLTTGLQQDLARKPVSPRQALAIVNTINQARKASRNLLKYRSD